MSASPKGEQLYILFVRIKSKLYDIYLYLDPYLDLSIWHKYSLPKIVTLLKLKIGNDFPHNTLI